MPIFGPPKIEKLEVKGSPRRLRKALHHEDVGIRLAATHALGRLGVLSGLSQALDDENLEVRLAATNALQTLGDLPGLTKALDDEDGAIRLAATRALGSFEDRRGVEALARVLQMDRSAKVRTAAAVELGDLAVPAAEKRLRRAAYSDKAESVRKAALTSLKKMLPPKEWEMFNAEASLYWDEQISVESMVLALTSNQPGVPEAATQALVDLGAAALETLISVLAEHARPEARAGAATALGHHRDPRANQSLLAAVRDHDASVREASVTALAKSGDLANADALIAARTDPQPAVRQAARHALQWLPGMLNALLADLDSRDRGRLLRALEVMGDMWCPSVVEREEVTRRLVAALRDPDEVIRAAAATSLGRPPDGNPPGGQEWVMVAPALARVAGGDSPMVAGAAKAALDAMKKYGRYSEFAPLITALEEDDINALRLYATRVEPDSVYPERDAWVAENAIRLLLALGDLDDSVAKRFAEDIPGATRSCELDAELDDGSSAVTQWQVYGGWIKAAKDFLDAHESKASRP